ncbi:hypothetical protein BH10PLA1_BH10PLA1_06750 [soil metagenome]
MVKTMSEYPVPATLVESLEPVVTVTATPDSNEADLVITAMEAGGHVQGDRRAQRRVAWRVQANVRLFVDRPGHPPRTIFTRDIHSRGLGFVTRERLPLGYGGVIDLPARDGSLLSVACTILRCRLASPGWY